MKTGALTLMMLPALTGACVNMSTLQTAKSLDPGAQRILVGGGYYASPSVDKDASASSSSDVSLALPYLEVGYRRGVVDRVEVGAKVTVPGTVGVDGKYQLVRAGNFAVAAGLGVSYLKIETESSTSQGGTMKSSTQLVDAIVPAYVSYDLAAPLAVYLSPKYVLRAAQTTDDTSTSRGISNLVGATAGVRVGDRFGVFLESSYLKDITSSFDSFQVNGSLFF